MIFTWVLLIALVAADGTRVVLHLPMASEAACNATLESSEAEYFGAGIKVIGGRCDPKPAKDA
jgi:hypothetical protein